MLAAEPGAMNVEAPSVTAPAMLPPPPRIVPEPLTETAPVPLSVPLTRNAPPLTEVGPE